jgi:hypothetical protein
MPPPAPLTITPDTATVNVGETLQFSVSGGTAPYLWGVSNPFVARISAGGLLTAVVPGTVAVAVRDATGAIDQSGLITVLGNTAPAQLSITPTTAQLTVGETLQFTASGGVPPYTWSSVNSLVATIDNNGVLTAKTNGLTSVRVRDSIGASVSTGLVFVAQLAGSVDEGDSSQSGGSTDTGGQNDAGSSDIQGDEDSGGGAASSMLIFLLYALLLIRRRYLVI